MGDKNYGMDIELDSGKRKQGKMVGKENCGELVIGVQKKLKGIAGGVGREDFLMVVEPNLNGAPSPQ